jgi:hypothetical protein
MSVLEPIITIPCGHHSLNLPIGYCWWCDFGPDVIAMTEKFKEKWAEYGLSYRTVPIKFLITRLEGEMEELQSNLTYEELIDISNQALMLAYRLRKEGK